VTILSHAAATTIVKGALAHAAANGLKPLGVLVLDAGGHPVAFERQDGASLYRFDIARAKAMGALGMGMDSRAITAAAADRPTFFQGVAAAVGGQIAFSPGGVLVRDGAGNVIGAVGISGDTGDNDEAAALAGIADAGLHGGTS